MLNFKSQMRPGSHFMVLAALLGILFSTVLMSAQSIMGTGSIQGTITDQKGAVLAGAKVIVTRKATGRTIQVTTSTTGTFASGPLPPGDYTLRVESKGVKSVELAVRTLVGVVSALRLQLGQENQLVGAPTNVDTAQATVQTVVIPESINTFPVNGSNYQQLAQLKPGVQTQDGTTIDPTKNGSSSISFQSRYSRGSRVEVDGVDIADETVGTTTQNIPASAIQEFNLSQSTLDVSNGLTSSGAVNIATRSGTNELHGQGFGSFRGNEVSANLPGTPVPEFHREQFGGRAGGYAIKDKLFWFIDGERVRQDLTAAQPFSPPFDVLHTSAVEPFRELQAVGKLDWQVKPNAHAFYRFIFDQNSQVRPYGASSSTQVFNNNNHTPSHTLGYDFSTGAYTHSLRFEYLKFRNGVFDGTGAVPAGVNNPIPGLGINIGAPVSGNCVLSGGGAYCGGPSYLAPQTTFQSDLETKYDGTHVFGGHIVRYGVAFNHIVGGGSSSFVTFPQVGTTGICLNSSAINCTSSSNPTAYAAQDVFLGNGIGFSTPYAAFGNPGGRLGPDNRIEAYVGDAWKASHNLMLTFGLSYVRDTGRVDSSLGPEPTLNQWVPGLGNTVHMPNANFAPQFGFAWDMGGKGKTVVRGGAGLYYENSIWNNVLFDSPARLKQGIFSYTPQVCSNSVPSPIIWPTNPGPVGTPIAGGAGVVVSGTNMVQPTFCGGTISSVAGDIFALSSAFQAASASHGAQPNPNYIGSTLSAANANGFDVFDPNYRTPRSWQMNLGFQSEIHPGTMLSVDFIRNVGLHYLLTIDRNSSGAARSYNQVNAIAARDAAQLANGCGVGLNQASCMVKALGQAGAQSAYSRAGLDSNIAVMGGGPCSFCAFPGITPFGQNNNGGGAGNGTLGALDMLEPVGRSVYNGFQIKLDQNVQQQWHFIKGSTFELSYSISKFVSQVQDQDSINLATNNDKPLQYTGPNALDRKHQISFSGTFNLPFFTRVSLIGHFYSPIPQNLQLPELTHGGEIFASDWLGTGLGSGAAPEPVPGTQIGQFMRGTDISRLPDVISNYNLHLGNTLTPAGHCLVSDGFCPGAASIAVMTQADMNALGWVLPTLAPLAPGAQNFPWLKTLDAKVAWPIKIRERFTIQPSASVFNLFNFSNAFLPGNLPSASLLPGGVNNTLAPSSVGGVNGSNISPFRSSFQSGTYALGAPRQIEFGLSFEF